MLDRCDRQITDYLAKDAGIGHSRPSHDFSVACIDGKDDADHLAIAGMSLQMIGASADVGMLCSKDAIKRAAGRTALCF